MMLALRGCLEVLKESHVLCFSRFEKLGKMFLHAFSGVESDPSPFPS
jgi:hypothetical protein